MQLGDGARVKFWEDIWKGDTSLQNTFPNLYRVSSQQKEVISNMGWFEGDTWRWVLSWKRLLSLEESREEEVLHSILQQHYSRRSLRDKIAWGQNGNFSVKNLYTKAVSQMESEVTVDRLSCSVWQKLAPPPKVEFMAWLALMGKLNTKERLVRRRVIPAGLNKCTFCNNHSEDINHLLLSCQFSWTVWKFIAKDLGGMVTYVDNLISFYANWLNKRFVNRTQRKLWVTNFFAIIWSLWMQRNGIIFKQQTLDMQALHHIIK